MKLLLFMLLALAASIGVAAEVRVVLVNGTSTDIAVESGSTERQTEVLPHQSKTVLLRQPQWVRFGQEACKYNIAPIVQQAKRSQEPVVLQANPGGILYVVPTGTNQPQTKLPPQPRGFPIKPTRNVDLI